MGTAIAGVGCVVLIILVAAAALVDPASCGGAWRSGRDRARWRGAELAKRLREIEDAATEDFNRRMSEVDRLVIYRSENRQIEAGSLPNATADELQDDFDRNDPKWPIEERERI